LVIWEGKHQGKFAFSHSQTKRVKTFRTDHGWREWSTAILAVRPAGVSPSGKTPGKMPGIPKGKKPALLEQVASTVDQLITDHSGAGVTVWDAGSGDLSVWELAWAWD
jgi:hypothetical protein